jgi:plastocyanin
MLKEDLRAIGLILAAVIGIATVAGCGGSGKPTSPAPGPTHSSHYHSVSIQNFAFSPASLNAAVADTVVWTNNDSTTHTVTSDSGSELDHSLAPGGTYQHIFAAAGAFHYHCSIHTTMHGLVTVQ